MMVGRPSFAFLFGESRGEVLDFGPFSQRWRYLKSYFWAMFWGEKVIDSQRSGKLVDLCLTAKTP